jgi:hypothetical protein
LKRIKVEADLERRFIAAMVTHKTFLALAAPLVGPEAELFEAKYTRQVAVWCVEHWGAYADAPGPALKAIYGAWVAREKPPEAEADAVLDFINYSTDDVSTPNIPHLANTLAEYLNARKLERLRDDITAHLSRGNVADAQGMVEGWRAVQNNGAAGYNPLSDAALDITYTDLPDSIVNWPVPARVFFGRAMRRASLIGVQGPEKRGKTFWCLEFMYRALRSGRKVAVFEVGDESEQEINLRFDSRTARLPLTAEDVLYPTAIKLVQGAERQEPQVMHTTLHLPALGRGAAQKAHSRFHLTHGLDPAQTHVMFSNHPNSTINVAGIDAVLKRWEYERAFVPDVIIIDYADILAPEDKQKEFRHQVNETWQALRKLSQVWSACVIAPTQADAASYDARTQTMKNFSEDKRKLSHVTAMLGLNQTWEEKEIGVMRLNWLVKRGERFNPHACLWVANCLPLGMAMVKCAL